MSRNRLKPEDVISAFYEEEGFYEVERGGDPESLYSSRLILSDGFREVFVSILDEDALMSKGALQDALLHAEKMKSKFDGVCIAIPRKYAKMIDENVMMLHGFGLIIYDKMGAEEIIPPRLAIRREGSEKQEVREQAALAGAQEIVELKRQISKLLRVIEELEARLDRLEKDHKEIVEKVSRIERSGLTPPTARKGVESAEARPRVEMKPRGSLPSYLIDNPWVEILSRRE
ncbi:MAG: hypothetical protein QXW02_03795 [Nitrososphaerota archaeon]